MCGSERTAQTWHVAFTTRWESALLCVAHGQGIHEARGRWHARPR